MQSEIRRSSLPATYVGLELVRVLACAQVFLSHFIIWFIALDVMEVRKNEFIEATLIWGQEAVLVFFILSGYVIALSQKRKMRTRSDFLRLRIRRLGLLYFVIMLLSVVVALITKFPALAPLPGHLLFLQADDSTLTPLFESNRPLWSLSFELYFYLLFAWTLSPWPRGRKDFLWILGFSMMFLIYDKIQAPGILGHLQMILAFLPVWLLGTTLVEKPIYFRLNLSQALVLFAIGLILARTTLVVSSHTPLDSFIIALFFAPLLYRLTQPHEGEERESLGWTMLCLGFLYLVASSYLALTGELSWRVKAFLIGLPPCLAFGCYFLPKNFLGWLEQGQVKTSILLLGQSSYVLYILHWPILMLVAKIFHYPGLRVFLDVFLLLLGTYWLEFKLQPWLAQKFDFIWKKPA